MKNSSNISIYSKWARVYDKFFGSSFMNKQRNLEINMLKLKTGDKVLFIGVGTGEDLQFLPKGVIVTGVDKKDA